MSVAVRVALLVTILAPSPLLAASCPRDAVRVGTTCIDRYEASVWRIPTGSTGLVKRIRRGTVTLIDLAAALPDFGFPNSGIFHYDAAVPANAAHAHIGFRCAR